MPEPLSNRLVVAVSAPALFDLAAEEEAGRARGAEEPRRSTGGRDGEVLAPGRAFPVVQALARLGADRAARRVELVLLSRASADASPRVFASLQEHAVHVARAAFTGGEAFAPYLAAFHVDLLLSEREEDVRTALLAGTPAAVVTARLEDAKQPIDQVRIAFDGDAAVFGQAPGEEADEVRPERTGAPLAKLLKALAELQTGDPDKQAVRTALLTRRASPAQERVLQSMREAKVRLDEAFFVGDLPREELLAAFRAHVFFDDGGSHFRVPEEIVRADLRATEEEAREASASSNSPFARLRLRSNS
jgi:5'-nucleotidase